MVRVLSVVMLLAVPTAAFAQEAPPPPPPADAPTQPAPLAPTGAPEAKKQWCNGTRSCGGGKAKAIIVTTVAATVITTVAVAIAVGVANANAQPANTLLVR